MSRQIQIDPERPAVGAIEDAAAIVRAGHLIAYPTETFYGLGADPFDAGSVELVFQAKGRPPGLALPVIVSDEAAVRRCVRDWGEPARSLAAAFWPGPLTLVLPASAALPSALLGRAGTVGIRISPHPVAAALARAVGGAVVATSANRSGQGAPTTAKEVAEALGSSIDLILDAGATRGTAPSTILDLSSDPPRVIREGAVPIAAVERVLGRRIA